MQIIELELLRKRFAFVDNLILRENLAISFQYILFLYSLNKETSLPHVNCSICKDMLIYTASIVEALLNYKVHHLLNSGKVQQDDLFEKVNKFTHFKSVYSSEDFEVGAVRKRKIYERMNGKLHFHKLNNAARKAGIFDQSLFEKSQKLRDMRNRIHLANLDRVEDLYTKEDVEEAFKIAKEIIEKINQ